MTFIAAVRNDKDGVMPQIFNKPKNAGTGWIEV